jgi:hypothetical protein
MLETREHPPHMSKTLMAVPLGGDTGDLGAPTTFVEDVNGGAPGGDARDLGASTTYVEDVDVGPPAPLGGPVSSMVRIYAVTCIGSIDRSNSAHGSQSRCT